MNEQSKIKQCIARGKWAVFYHEAGNGQHAFAYTAGLSHYGLNELLITGNLSPENACMILNMFGDLLRARKEKNPETQGFANGETVSLGGASPLTVFDANSVAINTLMLNAKEFCRGRMKAQQVLFPDKQGRFPTAPSYDSSTKQTLYI